MSFNGTVRKVDKNGRLNIPAFGMRKLGIKTGDCIEIFFNEDGGKLYLKKYKGEIKYDKKDID